MRKVIPLLMGIKDMRNRRVHNVSKQHPIFAREAYLLADNVTRFFELMKIEVSSQLKSDLHQFRREGLTLLFLEEMYIEANPGVEPYVNKSAEIRLNQ